MGEEKVYRGFCIDCKKNRDFVPLRRLKLFFDNSEPVAVKCSVCGWKWFKIISRDEAKFLQNKFKWKNDWDRKVISPKEFQF